MDFIKIGIQGAELDVFQGGVSTLNNVLAIVAEAGFIEHYVEQPLFGDVCSFLSKHQLQFQKIIGVGGRTMKPILLNNDPNLCSQRLLRIRASQPTATLMEKPSRAAVNGLVNVASSAMPA